MAPGARQRLRQQLALIETEISRDVFDHLKRDRFPLLKKSAKERVVADEVGDARNAARMLVDRLDRLRTDYFLCIAAGDAQAFGNVSGGLLRRERQRPGAQFNTLAKLPEFPTIQSLFELRLTSEHNLQKFFG